MTLNLRDTYTTEQLQSLRDAIAFLEESGEPAPEITATTCRGRLPAVVWREIAKAERAAGDTHRAPAVIVEEAGARVAVMPARALEAITRFVDWAIVHHAARVAEEPRQPLLELEDPPADPPSRRAGPSLRDRVRGASQAT